MQSLLGGLETKDAPIETTTERLSKKKDFSAEVKALLTTTEAKITANPTAATLAEILPELLELEKKTRLAMDIPSTVQLAEYVIQVCAVSQQWKSLGEQLVFLSKRRAQLQRVVKNIIIKAFSYVTPELDTATTKELLTTLRTVSTGKMFVELERARMTSQLSKIEEEAGDVAKAGEILNEVQVETIGSMDVREKAEILLEQLRLCLINKDYIRCEILANKVSAKTLEEEGYSAMKLRYYDLNIQFWNHENNHIKVCNSYRKIFDTPEVLADDTQWKAALSSAVVFCLLAPWDSDTSDITHRLKALKKIESLPVYAGLLEQFTTAELISWPLQTADVVLAHAAFTESKERVDTLKKRVSEHNVRVISKAYKQIRMSRVCSLLSLTKEECEVVLSTMVSEAGLYAKYDRPGGIISFTKKQKESARLEDWSNQVTDLLRLVDSTCHLIEKENQLAIAAEKKSL